MLSLTFGSGESESTQVYADTGCRLYPRCLQCPRARCIEDEPNGHNVKRAQAARLKQDIARDYAAGKSVPELARKYEVSHRTVHRAIEQTRGETAL